jgi:hypothetical protein
VRTLCLSFLLLSVSWVLVCPVAGQQAVTGPVVSPGSPSSASGQTESLADTARRLRSNKPIEVQMSAEDGKKLFRSVDKILAFASQDTGFPIRSTIKRRLVSQADVEAYTRDRLAKLDFERRFARTELTMKKFGLLPRDFKLWEFLVKSNGQQVAGYYDDETKSISMLNWVPLEQQEPVLAHELTHALQDQNYDLKTWAEAREPAGKKEKAERGMDESTLVRHAVAEGQAMVVYFDYMLAPYGRTLENAPGVVASMQDPAVRATIDTELLHKAPMVLREMGTFPYHDGLIFESELLKKGGKGMAFAGAFARPPQTTHEVLDPQAYIDHEKVPGVHIPDVTHLIANKYVAYDSGSMGELDVRALVEQYGERKIATTLSAAWRGGAYVIFQRASKETAPSLTTADLALLYVSRWKSRQAAERFARVYASAVGTRYQKATANPAEACSGAACPVFATEVSTEEGPIIVEQWPDNSVIVSESFDAATAAQLSNAVRGAGPEERAEDRRTEELYEDELSLRLSELPAFRAFQADLKAKILQEMINAGQRNRTAKVTEDSQRTRRGAVQPEECLACRVGSRLR